MGFQVSPGVAVSEIDLTTVVPAVSTTEGAISGVFRWGPVNQRVLVDSESNLVTRFGKPTNLNAETFFTAANFLSYGNQLYVVRAADDTPTASGNVGANAYISVVNGIPRANASMFVANSGVLSAVGTTGSVTVTDIVKCVVNNEQDYNDSRERGQFSDNDVLYIAKFPGEMGNSLRVSVCDSAESYSKKIDLTGGDANISSSSSLSIVVGSNTATVSIANSATGTLSEANTRATEVQGYISVGDLIEVGNTTIGKQLMRVTNVGNLTAGVGTRSFTISFDNVFQLSSNVASTSIQRYWEFVNSVDRAPGQSTYMADFGAVGVNDELHVVVVDEGGKFTGVPGTILEVYQNLSRATDGKTADGASTYYVDTINLNSNYVWWANHRAGAGAGLATSLVNSTNKVPANLPFVGGLDGADESSIAIANLAVGYDLFASAEDIDVSLILQGKARGSVLDNYGQLANYIIDNICESRKDCVAFVSPDRADVVSNVGYETDAIVAYRNSLRSTSYAVLDSGYKYQYDKYNDVYRYIPLNGDTAGLCVRTDSTRDPWWSPAGFNRGQIKNIVKLAYNPSKANRDVLYKAGVNPVVTFPGQGTILYGDKTLLAKSSAFDRINVRRLFIVLEKAISTASKFTLFEFNDEFTRSQFKNMVEPFLRDIQGRRGIYEYKVVCDSTNNTPEVIDGNRFVGDIYIKPAKSINFIQLNFVAVRSGVEFSEVVGQF